MRVEQATSYKLRNIIEKHFSSQSRVEFIPGKSKIPLVSPSFGSEEILEAIDSMLTTNVTMGEKVKQFESLFAQYIGVKYAVMVNSGSSANLMILSALINPLLENKLSPGDEIITPAVTWSTTVWPIINCNLVPVLVDVDLNTFNINIDEIRKAITPRTRAIMPVHLLGNPCNMTDIMQIAKEHNLLVIEDACEAHGAEYHGKKVGSFGDYASFSFFFSHHLSTIEGGMILTDNDKLAELVKALRVFGWIRDLKDKEIISLKYPNMDPRFIFYTTGYNFRPTEIQGAFGIHQIKKLDYFIDVRKQNVFYWSRHLEQYKKYFILHNEQPETRHVWFAYPITVRTDAPFNRKQLTAFLENKGVETRPIMAGNIAEQPAMQHLNYRKVGSLPNANLINQNSFFFGNHHDVKKIEREAIIEYIKEFIQLYTN